MAVERTRNYATIIYPDSVVSNWKEILTNSCVPCLVSPLHDKDVNATEEEKKPHYHIIFMFDGVKTLKQAQDLSDSIGGVLSQPVISIRGYARYLCHLDNPEKYQYSPDDVLQIFGADYSSVIGLSTDKYKALSEMQDFCEEYNVNSFYLLSKYARLYRMDWYRILCDCGSVYMDKFLKSRHWSINNEMRSIIDQTTGEIII